jgi:hypothetical protein
MRAYALLDPLRTETVTATPAVASGTPASHALLRACFEIFHPTCTGLAKLSIQTSNDLFEMDPLATMEEVHDFRSRRGEWVRQFDAALRELFERRMRGHRRKGRRPDPVQSLGSLRVMNDCDTSKQGALAAAAHRLSEAAKKELDALDYRVAILFAESPGGEVDNPFSPAYLLDAIGMTSRALYAEPRIWRPVMARVVGDFVPAIGKAYIPLNRFLAERGVVPEIGAVLRARSDLRPVDDGQLLPLFSRLLNDVRPSSQPWRTLDPGAAEAAGYSLAPLPVNPYALAPKEVPRHPIADAVDLPRRDRMMAAEALRPVLEALDCWQRADPMTEYLRSNAPVGIDAGVTPVNRIPWIHAATASRLPAESGRVAMDVVGFLFDYIFRDPSITLRFRRIYEGLQVPILKVALSDSSFFTDSRHAARRLLEGLADAAIGADDDATYGTALECLALSIVDAIRAEFVLDARVLADACQTLKTFTDDWQKQLSRAIQPHVDVALAQETRDADRSRVRVLVRDKLAGLDIPFDVRAFVGTVWVDNLTRLREAEGTQSDSYAAAVKSLDDLLWSIAAKGRTVQKAALSKMIPTLVRRLRAGGAALQVADEKMKRFLSVLYDLHIAAIKPQEGGPAAMRKAGSSAAPSLPAHRQIGNLHDFVAELVVGTWLAFDKDGSRVKARLSWISPWRATYVFATRAGSAATAFTPDELAWEMSTGRVTLIQEPVPLFDRAVNVTLDYLAEQKAKPLRYSASSSNSTIGIWTGPVWRSGKP